MTTSTLTLADFLKARFAEDARVAREALANRSPKSRAMVVTQALVTPDGTVEMSPDRVLIECEAKRRIVELHEHIGSGGGVGCMLCHDYPDNQGYAQGIGLDGWCETVRALAIPHADHPDYREEWRP